MLVEDEVSEEYKSVATIQFLNSASEKDKAIFAIITLPYFKEYSVVNDEAMNELSNMAVKVFHVRGTLQWKEHESAHNTTHPKWSVCAKYLAGIPETEIRRKKRLKQVLLFLVLNDQEFEDPGLVDEELNDCLIKIRSRAAETV